MNWTVKPLVLALLAVLAYGAGSPIAAQGPESDCDLPPLTLPLFGATPAAEVAASPVSSTNTAPVDDGEIRTAVETIISCANSGDAAFRYSIFTERYLAEQLADSTAVYQPAFEQELSLGDTNGEGQLILVDVRDISALDDGRVRATIETRNGSSTYTDTMVLANVNGAWLIDEIESFDPPR